MEGLEVEIRKMMDGGARGKKAKGGIDALAVRKGRKWKGLRYK